MRLEVLEILAHALQHAVQHPSIHDEGVCAADAKLRSTPRTRKLDRN